METPTTNLIIVSITLGVIGQYELLYNFGYFRMPTAEEYILYYLNQK